MVYLLSAFMLFRKCLLYLFLLLLASQAQAQFMHWGSEYSLGLTEGRPFRHNFTYDANDIRVKDGPPILTAGVGFPMDVPFRQLGADSRLSVQLKPAISFALPLHTVFKSLGHSVVMYELPLLLQYNKGVYGSDQSDAENGWVVGAGMHLHGHHVAERASMPASWVVLDWGKSRVLGPALQAGYRFWSNQNRLTTLQVYLAPVWENYAGQTFNRSTLRLSLTTFYNY